MLTKKYLLLTNNGELIAKGLLEGWGGEDLRLKRLEGKPEDIREAKVVQLISNEADELPIQCCVLRCDDERILLKKITTLNLELRRNLRIPVTFNSYLYPISGSWKGRKALQSIDLSCGGIAFYADDGLEAGETVEIVIPKTTFPLIVKMGILRKEKLNGEQTFYAGKFLQLEREEENMIREAVFSIQLQNRKRTQAQETKEG